MTFDLNKFKSKGGIEIDVAVNAQDAAIPTTRAVVPGRIAKRRKRFVMLPWTWVERLSGAGGKTWEVAAHLRDLNFQHHGAPFKLGNGMLEIDGVSRQSKWRALRELEKRGLIVVECHAKRSPIIRLLS